MAPKPKTISDDQLDDLDEEFGSGLEDDDDFDIVDDTSNEVEDESDVEVEEPEAEIETDDEPESVSVRSLAEKFGFQLEDSDDEVTALESFFDKASQLQTFARQAAQERQQLQQQLAYAQQQQYQPQQQPAQPTEQKPPELQGLLKHWQNVPEFHRDWLSYVTYDENNNLVSKPGADPTLPQKIEAYKRWEQEAQSAMLTNPQQFVFDAIQANPTFEQAIQQRIEQAVFGLQDKIEARRIAEQREQHIYQINANGEKELSPAGQVYVTAVQEASEAGITNNEHLDRIGYRAMLPYIQMAQAQAKQQQEQPKETPAENKKRRQLEFAKQNATKKPNRGKKKSEVRKIRNQEDFINVAMARMEEAGIDPHAKVSS